MHTTHAREDLYVTSTDSTSFATTAILSNGCLITNDRRLTTTTVVGHFAVLVVVVNKQTNCEKIGV